MQIEYKGPSREVLKKFLEVQAAESTAEAIEYVWEEAFWEGMRRAFLQIGGYCDNWRENVV